MSMTQKYILAKYGLKENLFSGKREEGITKELKGNSIYPQKKSQGFYIKDAGDSEYQDIYPRAESIAEWQFFPAPFVKGNLLWERKCPPASFSSHSAFTNNFGHLSKFLLINDSWCADVVLFVHLVRGLVRRYGCLPAIYSNLVSVNQWSHPKSRYALMPIMLLAHAAHASMANMLISYNKTQKHIILKAIINIL